MFEKLEEKQQITAKILQEMRHTRFATEVGKDKNNIYGHLISIPFTALKEEQLAENLNQLAKKYPSLFSEARADVGFIATLMSLKEINRGNKEVNQKYQVVLNFLTQHFDDDSDKLCRLIESYKYNDIKQLIEKSTFLNLPINGKTPLYLLYTKEDIPDGVKRNLILKALQTLQKNRAVEEINFLDEALKDALLQEDSAQIVTLFLEGGFKDDILNTIEAYSLSEETYKHLFQGLKYFFSAQDARSIDVFQNAVFKGNIAFFNAFLSFSSQQLLPKLIQIILSADTKELKTSFRNILQNACKTIALADKKISSFWHRKAKFQFLKAYINQVHNINLTNIQNKAPFQGIDVAWLQFSIILNDELLLNAILSLEPDVVGLADSYQRTAVDLINPSTLPAIQEKINLQNKSLAESDFIRFSCFDYLTDAPLKDNEDDAFTLLWVAANSGSSQIVNFLVTRGVSVDQKNTSGWTPLLFAVKKGILNTIKFLVEEGADVNQKNKYGDTSLDLAIDREQLDIVEYLLRQGGKFNDYRRAAFTRLLTRAIFQHNLELVEILLKKGADANQKDEYGRTPLVSAVQCENHELVEMLLKEGADVNQEDAQRMMPLMYAVQYEKNLALIKLLLTKNPYLNKENSEGVTPLSYIIKRRNLEVLKLLWTNHTDVNQLKDVSPLYWIIAEIGHHISFDENKAKNRTFNLILGLITSLVRQGANVCNSNDPKTPLQLAMDKDQPEIVEALLIANAKNQHGAQVGDCSAASLAFDIKQHDVVSFLLRKKTFTFLKGLPNFQHMPDDVLQEQIKLMPPFKLAIISGDVSLLTRCVSKKNIKGIDNQGKTPLLLAIEFQHPQVVKILLENGADASLKNGLGLKPLELATNIAMDTTTEDAQKIVHLIEEQLAKTENNPLPLKLSPHNLFHEISNYTALSNERCKR